MFSSPRAFQRYVGSKFGGDSRDAPLIAWSSNFFYFRSWKKEEIVWEERGAKGEKGEGETDMWATRAKTTFLLC